MQAEIRENTAIKESWSVIHPLNPEDSAAMTALRSSGSRYERQTRRSRRPRSI
jgi:hypothetical protein